MRLPMARAAQGETMGALPVELLEAWRWEEESMDMVRQPQFEGPLTSHV